MNNIVIQHYNIGGIIYTHTALPWLKITLKNYVIFDFICQAAVHINSMYAL